MRAGIADADLFRPAKDSAPWRGTAVPLLKYIVFKGCVTWYDFEQKGRCQMNIFKAALAAKIARRAERRKQDLPLLTHAAIRRLKRRFPIVFQTTKALLGRKV